MRKIASALLCIALSVLFSIEALAQSSTLSAGPLTSGHAPQYSAGAPLAVLRDGGGSGGGTIGTTLGEIGVTSRSSTNTYPSASSGNGPNREHLCLYDAPTLNNPNGFHYVCLDPNANGGGLLSFGAGGGATPLPLQFLVNGTPQQVPITRQSLGAAASGANSDITSLGGLTSPQPTGLGSIMGTPFTIPGATFGDSSQGRGARRPDAKSDYGAICDGQQHPLSDRFGTGAGALQAAQQYYPYAVDIGEETDTAALAGLIQTWRTSMSASPTTGVEYRASGLGQCQVNRTLNMSNFRDYRSIFHFDGTKLLCYGTGLICVDGSMNEFATYYDLDINGQSSNPPLLGLFLGRDNTTDRCNNNSYFNLTVVNDFTFAAVDNFACEVNTFIKPTISNIAPNAFGWVQDGMNHWGIASPTLGNTAPQNVANSLYSDVFIGGSSTVTGTGSTPIWLASTSSNRFDGFYTTATGTASATKANVWLYSYKPGDENQGLQWLSHTEGGRTGNAAFFLFTGPNTTQTVMNMTYTDSGYGALVNHLAADAGVVSVNLPGFKYDVGNLHSGENVFDQPSVYTTQGFFNLGNATTPQSWNLPATSWSGCLTVAGSVTCKLGGTMQPYGQNVSLSGTGINVSTAGPIASLAPSSSAGYGANTAGVYSFPTLTISTPDVTGGTQATANITAWAFYAAPDALQDGGSWPPGGTGYLVNDVLTVPGGTCPIPPQIKVLTVDGNGGILTWAKQTTGNCTVAMSMPVSLTGGTGTGATLSRMAWTPLTYSVTNGGTGYIAPTFSFSAGTYNNQKNPGITSTVTPGPYLINGNPLPFETSPASNDAQYISLFPTTATTSAAAPSQNVARCAAFTSPVAEHVDQLSLTVTTLGTGPLNVSLYSDAIDATTQRHQPQAAVGSGSFVVTSAATVQAAIGTNGVGVPLSAGINWACINDTNAADAVRLVVMAGTSTYEANLIGSSTPANVTSVNANISSLVIGQTAGTWPSYVGATFTDSAGVAMPLLSARVASVP